jgi:oxalate decarboxylase/phosphoglucose isomerase-like protein (cupin superfamily)
LAYAAHIRNARKIIIPEGENHRLNNISKNPTKITPTNWNALNECSSTNPWAASAFERIKLFSHIMRLIPSKMNVVAA